jgi:hypothetical protein
MDPDLQEQPGGDRKVATAPFLDRDDRHSGSRSGLLFTYGERDQNALAGVDAFAINQTDNPGARNRGLEAVHAPRIQPNSTLTVLCTIRVPRWALQRPRVSTE